jgi:hypothetical protein
VDWRDAWSGTRCGEFVGGTINALPEVVVIFILLRPTFTFFIVVTHFGLFLFDPFVRVRSHSCWLESS